MTGPQGDRSWPNACVENDYIVSGCVQDWEHARCLGACGALTDLQRATQGEHVPAECLSRNEKKAALSFYSSPTIYNRWVMQRKELIKKKRQLPIIANEERSDKLDEGI